MRLRVVLVVVALVAGGLAAFGTGAQAAGVQKLHFEFGPAHLDPGQNIIQNSTSVPKPNVDGWIVGIKPNLKLTNGTIPPVDIIHLHHAVWLNLSRADGTAPGIPQRFFATGEEKTSLKLPKGYGYRYRASDTWLLNYMLHNLVDTPFDVVVTYDLEFLPDSSGTALTEAKPLWMDVQNGSGYPVFDALRGQGTNNQYTYPDQAVPNPYPVNPKNVWTVPAAGKLIGAAGHLHPGGLWTDLHLDRSAQHALLFRSDAKYFEKAGPVSWDVALKVTPPSWNVAVNAGDKLRITATYDTSEWSWYEAMGIMMLWWVPGDTSGTSPFSLSTRQLKGKTTHGHLKENNNHGGRPDDEFSDPGALPSGPIVSNVDIIDFEYEPGDLDHLTQVPTVQAGDPITFVNEDAPANGYGIWHSITACALPCNRSTGIAYPTANAATYNFDSGQLGNFGQPTSGQLTWATPTNLPTGTYAYFCRVHPFMRGAFRVVP